MLGWPLIWTESNHPPGIGFDALRLMLDQAAVVPVDGRIYRVVHVERSEGPQGATWRAELRAVALARPLVLRVL